MRVYRLRQWPAGFALAGMLALPVCAAGQAKRKTAEAPEAVYKRQCAGCHGPDGSGKTSMGKVFKLRDLKSEEVQKLTDAELFDIIAKGKGKMPAYANNLGHDNIHNLVKYVRELGKKK